MNDYLWIMAWNAAIAALLGGVLLLVSRTTYMQLRPGLRQALWMLVLLKLITPPLVGIPILPNSLSSQPAQAYDLSKLGDATPAIFFDERRVPMDAVDAVEAYSGNLNHSSVPFWLIALAAFFGLGTLLIAFSAIRQIHIAIHLLRNTQQEADSHLQQVAEDIGERLGIHRTPSVRLVAGPVSPMLWVSLRGPVILIPKSLLGTLSEEQLHAVIGHELAHYKRCDHWTNGFVLALTALFWWNPIVWWARREIHNAQELCCDALVINGGVATRRDYAETLFAVLEFIRFQRPLLPQLASGFGSGSSVKRRFLMIANHKLKHRLTWGAGLLVLAAAVILPMAFVQAQAENGEGAKQQEGEGGRKAGEREGGGICGTIKKLDLKKQTIIVEHRGDGGNKIHQLKLSGKVKITGFVQKLKDLRPGLRVQVQVSADGEAIAVQTFREQRGSREGRVFAAYDKDGNDKVSFKEWCAMKEGKFDKARTALEKSRFDAVDKNRDLSLSFEEFSAWRTGGRRGDGGGERAANVKVVTITGLLSKTEQKRTREDGTVLVVPKYYLQEKSGNRVQLPTPRKRDNGILIDKYDLEFFVGKNVILTGRGRIAQIGEGANAPTRVVALLDVTEAKEVKK